MLTFPVRRTHKCLLGRQSDHFHTQACGLLDNLDLDSINTSTDGLARVLNACKNLKSLAIAQVNCAIPPEIALPTLCSITLRQCKATDDVMTAIASHCPLLQTLKVFDSNSITDVGVRAVLQGCPLLRETDVEYAHCISSELRVELAKRAQLKEVDFQRWLNIDEGLVLEVLRVSPSVTKLTHSIASLSDETLVMSAQFCPLLEVLNIVSGGYCVSNAAMMQLLKPGNKLQKVRLCGCTRLGDDVLLAMAQHCPLLSVLTCAEFALTDDAVVQLAQGCPELILVDLKGTSVGDTAVTALATHCSGLQYLNLSACSNVTMDGVRALAEHCHHLTTLFLPSHFQTESLPALKAPGAKVVVRRF
jgi:F-box/leucine-rich repeat protein 17